MVLDAISTCKQSAVAGLQPDPDLLLSEWANLRRILPQGAAKEHGPYRWERVPFWKEPMDVLSPCDPTQEVCVMKGVQIGATTLGENLVLYAIDQAPGPIMWVMPTGDMAEEHSKDRLQPAIAAMPCLKDKVREAKSRDSGNTILNKRFPGGSLKLTGSNSAKAFRSKQIRYLILDDVDGFDAVVGAEGDPCALARKRTTTYASIRKVYENSTPTVKGLSRIERSYLDSDQRQYHVPCPHCGHKQVLKWGGKGAAFGLKFDHQGPTVTDAWYECQSCHSRIDEGHKPGMLAAGVWIPGNPENRNRRGYHLSSLYSPLGWKSWREIAQEFLAAGKNKALLQVWTNTLLAETWEDEGTQPDWVAIKNRAEPYPILEVPRGGLLLTAGVDVQDNRLSLTIWAWGRGEEAWLVYWGEIYEDPAGQQAWVNLDEILNRPYRHANGVDLSILSAGIDSGGHHTQTVYNYCRTRRPRVFALKGHSRKATPIISRPTLQDVTAGGQTIKGGVQLWLVGSDTAKAQLYSRLQITEAGPGKIHTPIGMDDDFYRQLTSEKLVTRFHKGFPVTEWVLESGARNEGLDCFDKETEVMTRHGWKLFKDLSRDDEIGTVNLQNDFMEYQKPIYLIGKQYSGEMISLKSKRIDILVTPEHRMVTYKKEYRIGPDGKRKWCFDVPPAIVLAKDLTIYHSIKVRCKWQGESNDLYVVPASYKDQERSAPRLTKYGTWRTFRMINRDAHWKSFKTLDEAQKWLDGFGSTKKEIEPERPIDPLVFAEFIGWYVSEGYRVKIFSKTQGSMRYRVGISQTNPEKCLKIEKLLNALPWKWHKSESSNSFIIASKQLYDEVECCGDGVLNKRVPEWVKNSSPEVIGRFLESAIDGDGWMQRKHEKQRFFRTYSTISKVLADDIQECFIKIGFAGNVKIRNAAPYKIRGRIGTNTKDQYWVTECKAKSAYLQGSNMKFLRQSIQYEGMIYCATVPNGTLICRRNGKSFIAGNCTVYSLAAAMRIGLQRMDWDELEKAVAPPEGQDEEWQKRQQRREAQAQRSSPLHGRNLNPSKK